MHSHQRRSQGEKGRPRQESAGAGVDDSSLPTPTGLIQRHAHVGIRAGIEEPEGLGQCEPAQAGHAQRVVPEAKAGGSGDLPAVVGKARPYGQA